MKIVDCGGVKERQGEREGRKNKKNKAPDLPEEFEWWKEETKGDEEEDEERDGGWS